jgi:magnesium-transporting ATPase (P-type)
MDTIGIINTLGYSVAIIFFTMMMREWYDNPMDTPESKNRTMKHIVEIFAAWVFSIFIPIFAFLQIVFLLIFLDFLLGSLAAWWSKEKFDTRKFIFTGVQAAGFTMLLVAFSEFQRYFKIPEIEIGELHLSVAGVVTGMIMYHKIKSIDGNCFKLFGFSILGFIKEKFPVFSVFESSRKIEDERDKIKD